MSHLRVGWGFDAHRFGGSPPLVLGGVVASDEMGVEATSDGDVAVHAIIDAILGASALGDLGSFFPSSDSRWHHADSFDLLAIALGEALSAGWSVDFVDVTVICQDVRIAPIREEMRSRISRALGLGTESVSVKATTTDRLGFIGEGAGLAAAAAVTVVRTP